MTSDRSIIFTKPWGKRSWLVEYDGPYNNSRPPHVEVVDFDPTPGSSHPLKNLHVMGGKALVWDVEDVTNRGEQAHFTVYYGDDPHLQMPGFL